MNLYIREAIFKDESDWEKLKKLSWMFKRYI